jgi:hypothetical protein
MQGARCATRAADTPIARARGLYGAETGTGAEPVPTGRPRVADESRTPGARPLAAAKVMVLVAGPGSRAVP